MSGVPEAHEVVAILCSDLHFSDNPPISRSVEPDWFEVMGRYIDQLKVHQKRYDCPIIVAGDVFDRWKCSPHLINFLIKRLPRNCIYAVPGQHDLPNHDYQRIQESAYWTLVEADIITNLECQNPVKRNGIWMHGIPWDFHIQGPTYVEQPNGLHLAVIHSYVWIKGKSYPDAPEKQRLKRYFKALEGYDAAVFGDNHMGFVYGEKKPYIMNCGSFIRRKIDEIDYKPMIGLLEGSGRITPINLITDEDKFIDTRELERTTSQILDGIEFLKEMTSKGGELVTDFVTAVERYCKKNNVEKSVRDIITTIFEKE
jgi:DNA repair exonuclease SbcCD nuclease subunit